MPAATPAQQVSARPKPSPTRLADSPRARTRVVSFIGHACRGGRPWCDAAPDGTLPASTPEGGQLSYYRPAARRYDERRAATPEDIASSDEMIKLVQYAMAGASAGDREAFILHAIEGFMIDEVATITDRKPDEVISSINSVRERLRRSPPIAGRFYDKTRPSSAAD